MVFSRITCIAPTEPSAIHDVGAVDLSGERLDAGGVGAGVGLGDAERADLLPANRRRQEALLLVVGADLPPRRRRDPDVCADPGGEAARAAVRELLGEDGVVQIVTALTAVLLRVLQSQIAVRGKLVEHLVGEPTLVLVLLRV